jgi:hypothetical protein
MKKLIVFCILFNVTSFVASGQPKMADKPTGPAIFSVPDLAANAVMRRNVNKESIPVSEFKLLRQLTDEHASLVTTSNKSSTRAIMPADRKCPCPSGYGFCTCDTMAITAFAAPKLMATKLMLIGYKASDTIHFVKKAASESVVLHEVPDKLKDEDYMLIIKGNFGGGDPAPMVFELPMYVRKGKLHFRK